MKRSLKPLLLLLTSFSFMILAGCDNQSSSQSGSGSAAKEIPQDAPESVIPDSENIDNLTLTSEINGLDITLNWQNLSSIDYYTIVMSGGNFPRTEVEVRDSGTYTFSVSQDQYFNIVVKGFDAEGNMLIASQTVAIDMEANNNVAGSDTAP